MMQKYSFSSMRMLTMIALAIALGACGSDQRELQTYIDAIKARPGTGIEPLPEFRPAPVFVYEARDRRSPFVPDSAEQIINDRPDAVDAPDFNRPLEFLEQQPLDSLAMVGTIYAASADYGLVQDSEGRIHRVTVGNYMGQNYGRITMVTESEIQLVETVRDSRGGYSERPTSIALGD